MREITVPAPIQCVHVLTHEPLAHAEGAEWSLYRFVVVFIGQRADWTKPLTRVARLFAFLAELDKAASGGVVSVSDEFWRELRDTLEDPAFEIPFPYNLQLPPLAAAILNAEAR